MNMTMENFEEIDFEEDEFAESSPQQEVEPSNPEEPQELEHLEPPVEEEDSDDLTSEVLRLKGISDINKIKFEDESGAVIERPWDSLTRDEQINILTSNDNTNNLLEDEEKLLNSIRNSGLNVDLYMRQLIEVNTPEIQKEYKIDELSDDDVYALDLLDKVGSDNITDEELAEAVENAKQNKELFDKTVEGLRKEYIRLLEDLEAKLANEEAEKQKEAYNNFASSIVTLIRGLNSFAGRELELSNEDRENLSEFILNLDDQGTSAFGRALQDPKLFTKAAFWLLNEDEIVGELTKLILDNYKRGYEAAKKDLSNQSKMVIKPKQPNLNKSEGFMDDIDDWD